MGKAKKIGIGVSIAIVGFFAIGFGSIGIWSAVDPEGYEQSIQEREEQREKELREQAEKLKESQPSFKEQFEAGLSEQNVQDKEKCFDIDWKYHTQEIYKTMSEEQYCPEFRDQLQLACSSEAKEWWTEMQELWGCS